MRRPFVVLLCSVMGIFVAGASVPRQTEGPTQLVNTIRFLNTQEYLYRHDNGRFAPREEMTTFLRKNGISNRSPIDLENPKLYEIAITTSPDGMHYLIMLRRPTDMNDKNTWCRTAAFSDDGGVIFLGVALGCEAATQ